MFDFAQARLFMIEGQIRTNEITDPDIVSAMNSIPREDFVPDSWKTLAYSDHEIPMAEAGQAGNGRTMLTPMVLGKLLRAAEIRSSDTVLHLACGTGYGTAILSRMARFVVAVDEDGLAQTASANLARLSAENVSVVAGDLAAGCPEQGPYDVILIEGAIEVVPDALAEQLKPEGRLVTICGGGRSGQGTVYTRTSHGLSGFPKFGAAAPVLRAFAGRREFVF
jgi:protein-L-isoaspartate(D-aspartate) O-methyltransferase